MGAISTARGCFPGASRARKQPDSGEQAHGGHASRLGVTEKISISLSRSDLASLKKRAKRLYAGNVSAVVHTADVSDLSKLAGTSGAVHVLGIG
jgi:hypothetical protein